MRRSARGVVVDFAELSDPGRDPAKQINEDAAGYLETPHGHLAVVCDGMGGHAGGRQASETALRTIFEHVQAAPAGDAPSDVLKAAIEAAGRAVHAVGGAAPQELRPGSTTVALLVHEAGAEVAHVGDSRGYHVKKGAIQRITRDHSMVQQMVDAGVLSADEAPLHPDANKITRALGMMPEVEVELAREPVPIVAGDCLLLASDGLTDLVSDAEMLAIVQRGIASGPAVVCQDLVALANERGGHDNITVQLLHIVEAPPMRARAPDPTFVDVGRGGSGTLPGHTLVDDAAQPPAAGRPGKTLPGNDKPRPAPTLLDDQTYPPRTTQPGDAPKEARPAGAPLFADEPYPGPVKMPTRQARSLVLLGGGAALVIVVGVAAWWIVGSVRRSRVEEPPPPEPTATATAKIPPATSIEPEPEARPSDAATADAGRTKDAGTPDATAPKDAGKGAP